MVGLGAAAPARAGDPIMPLSQVRAGMHCTAFSVVKGTDIASFNADVVDVLTSGRPTDARILVRVSGPAVDATGIGPGFSGSPIYCPDDQGTQRNIGAISEGTNDFGNKTVLATPIEQILGESPDPPRAARSQPRLLRSARPLAGPMTISGVSPALGRVLSTVARKAGQTLIAVPAGPLGSFPVQQLVPGAAVSIGYSSGDVALGALGTVAYVDGDKVWAFDHSLDSAGPRSSSSGRLHLRRGEQPGRAERRHHLQAGRAGPRRGDLWRHPGRRHPGHIGPAPPRPRCACWPATSTPAASPSPRSRSPTRRR